MSTAKVTIEFSGKVEIPTQGWSDETKLNQIKKQAADEVNHWRLFVKKGAGDYIPMDNVISFKVTEVTLPII